MMKLTFAAELAMRFPSRPSEDAFFRERVSDGAE